MVEDGERWVRALGKKGRADSEFNEGRLSVIRSGCIGLQLFCETRPAGCLSH